MSDQSTEADERERVLAVVEWAAHVGFDMARSKATSIIPDRSSPAMSLRDYVRMKAAKALFPAEETPISGE